MVGRTVADPGQIQANRGRVARLAPIHRGRVGVHHGRRRATNGHHRQRIFDQRADIDAVGGQLQSCSVGHRQVVGDRCHHRPVGTDDHRRPPRHAQVGIEADPRVAGDGPGPGHEIKVVGLIPQRVLLWRMALFVQGVDEVVAGISHRPSRESSPTRSPPSPMISTWCQVHEQRQTYEYILGWV